MASRTVSLPLGRLLRGVAWRASRELREGVARAVTEARLPLERAARQWVGDTFPRLRPRQGRSYEGAKGGRRGEGWLARSTSANAEIARDLVKLRDRARDLGRNDAIAGRVIEASTIHVVGTGIRPKSATADAALDKRVDDLFEAWQKRCSTDGCLSFYALQALAWRAVAESGEVLVRRVPRPSGHGLPVPLQLDVLEGDFLDHTLGAGYATQAVPATHYVVQGVEFDDDGRRAAYHLWRMHPGETSALLLNAKGSMRVRVAASDVAHVYRVLRPGQVRGVTILAPIMWTLRQVGLYLDAELERKGTEALVTAITRNAQPGRAGIGELTTRESDEGITQVIGQLEPGAVLNIDGGEDVVFNHPVATDPASSLKGLLRRIAAGVGMPYELLSADLEGVNYSSIRYGTLPFRLGVWMQQEQVLIPRLCEVVWGWFIDAAIAAGLLEDRPDGYPVKWASPRWEEVDRLKEAMADVMEIRSGLRSYEDVLASRGEDWRQVLQEAKTWIEAMESHGISVDCDPRRPQNAAASVAVDPAANPAPADAPKVAAAA